MSTSIPSLTAQITMAYFSSTPVASIDVPGFVARVALTLGELEGVAAAQTIIEQRKEVSKTVKILVREHDRVAKVKAERSVFESHIVCMNCGKRFRTLARHLNQTHGITPAQYLARWNLPSGYPLVAPATSAIMSKALKDSYAGRNGR